MRLRQRRNRQLAAQAAAAPTRLGEAQGSSVLWDNGAGACGGAGQTQGMEGALGSGGSKEGNVIDNGGEVCLFIKLLGNLKVPEVVEEPQE